MNSKRNEWIKEEWSEPNKHEEGIGARNDAGTMFLKMPPSRFVYDFKDQSFQNDPNPIKDKEVCHFHSTMKQFTLVRLLLENHCNSEFVHDTTDCKCEE